MNDPPTIYVSSKRQHAQLWLSYRRRGHNIISSWIDLDGAISIENLGRVYWPLWLTEAATADYLIFYAHPQDVNHSSNLLEIGACLYGGGTVLHVGVSDNTKVPNGNMADFTYHPRFHRLIDLKDAFTWAKKEAVETASF